MNNTYDNYSTFLTSKPNRAFQLTGSPALINEARVELQNRGVDLSIRERSDLRAVNPVTSETISDFGSSTLNGGAWLTAPTATAPAGAAGAIMRGQVQTITTTEEVKVERTIGQ